MTAVKTNPATTQKKFDADIAALEKLDPSEKASLEKIQKQADAQFKKEEDAFDHKAPKKPSTKTPPKSGTKTPTKAPEKAPPHSNQLLHGADTSAYQSNAQFQGTLKGAKWSAIKATQGTDYTDPTFKARWKELGEKVKSGQLKLRMAYGFLNPGNGTDQAKHLLSTLGIKGKMPAGTRVALDWEGPALGDSNTLKQAADYIHKTTGTWPVVYCSES